MTLTEMTVNPPIRALLFDLDGVLTDTAEYHFLAWKRLADEEGIPFTRQENEALRGVSREESLRQLLKGRPLDPETAQAWMERKNRYYRELLQKLGPQDLLPGVASFLAAAKANGLQLAVVSASRNAPEVLKRLGIAHLFQAIVTGADAVRSKPAPDLFLLAARRLNLSPVECIGVEDAAAGVTAIHRAGMVAVGIGPRERVGAAELVLPGLENVRPDRLLWAATWRVREKAFRPENQHYRETILTQGNGMLSTRGTLEERWPGDRQATLIHGLWDDAPIVHTELANGFDWTRFEIRVNGQPFALDRGQVMDYARHLDLLSGELQRRLRWISPDGAAVDLYFLRFADLADPHALAARVVVEPVDREVRVEVRAWLDSRVENLGLLHWREPSSQLHRDRVFLQASTRHTRKKLGMGMTLIGHGPVDGTASLDCPGAPGLSVSATLPPGQTLSVEKLVAVLTGQDGDDLDERLSKKLEELNSRGFQALRQENRQAWQEFWADSDVIIEGDDEAQVSVRHALFQLRIAAPKDNPWASIGARTLSGFGYRGHVFWDTEIFMLPFFTYTQPELARNLLLYRWHTLPGARRKAAQGGYQGAQYAWESAETGDEVTPRWVVGPDGEELVRIWCGDIEIHVTADVAYAIWQYWQATGDDRFMASYGVPILLETARFWESRVEPDVPVPGQFAISDVIGPDEYHEHVDNNAYTNRMVIWHLAHARKALAWLEQSHPEEAAALRRRLKITPERLAYWQRIEAKLVVRHDPKTGLIEQFDGFFQLPEVDWSQFAQRESSMQALLGIQGANTRQVLKQPDVILLLCLLRDEYGPKECRANWEYYAPRTDHTYGSSLGPAIHAWAACELGEPETAYEHFMRAARADLRDVRGNAADGIHAASAGAVWQALVFGFAGLRFEGKGPRLQPRLPSRWQRLAFTFYRKGRRYRADLRAGEADSLVEAPRQRLGPDFGP